MNEEFDNWTHRDSLMDELKESAFEYLLLNPGSEFGDWQQGMLEQCPTEVVDALGCNPDEVFAALADLWESDYEDPKTGIEQKFSEWAMSFANEYAVGIYYSLVDACQQSADVGLLSEIRQVTNNRPLGSAAQAAIED